MTLAVLLADIYKGTQKPSTTPSLRTFINKYFAERTPGARRPGVHVTDLVDPCIRRIAWKIARPDIVDPAPEPAAARFFDQGNATHKWWQNEIYGPAGILYGDWRCTRCQELVTNTTMPAAKCKKSFTGACAGTWEFIEPEVNIDIHGVRVTGNSDGRLLWEGELTLLEMKSMRTEDWTKLKLPWPKHIMQGSIYAPELGVDKIWVSCIGKDEWDTKDFLVPVMPSARDWAINIVRTASSVKDNPLKGACACKNDTVVRAKRCAMRKMCFPK
jgi:hypothetical protein